MEEIWRDVPGYEGIYQINIDTPEGRCRSVYKGKNIKILSNNPSKEGRIFWHLHHQGKKICQQAAVWIALTYPELIQNEYFEGAEIDHINTDRLDNRPENLRWVTRKGQFRNPLTQKHMSESGKIKIFTEEHRKHLSESHKGKTINHQSFSKPVEQYSIDGIFIKEYPSAKEASRITGITHNSICDCCRKRIRIDKQGKSHHHNTAGGFVWKYKKEAV